MTTSMHDRGKDFWMRNLPILRRISMFLARIDRLKRRAGSAWRAGRAPFRLPGIASRNRPWPVMIELPDQALAPQAARRSGPRSG